MDIEVERRVCAAMTRGSDRLIIFGSGRRRFLRPSQAAIADHGPQAVGHLLLTTLSILSEQSPLPPQPLLEQGVAPWQQLLTGLMPFKAVIALPSEMTEGDLLNLGWFSPQICTALEGSMHSFYSLALKLLGTMVQSTLISNIASHRAWYPHGFDQIHEMLQRRYGDASPLKQDALLTVARFAAYTINIIETYSHLEELSIIKMGLAALQQGAIPIAHDKRTGIIYITNFHTL